MKFIWGSLRSFHIANTILHLFVKMKKLWNRKIQIEKAIVNNIPNLVLTFKDQKITYIFDFSVPIPTNTNNIFGKKQ